jgi:hypothetical protein
MEDEDPRIHEIEKMAAYIKTQLSEENLRPMIEKAITSTISEHIQAYLNSHLEDFIKITIQAEINELTENFNSMITQILQEHNKNIEILKSIQYHLAEKINFKPVDRITQAFDRGEYAEAFELMLSLEDDDRKVAYLACIDPSRIDKLPEDTAAKVALWGISTEIKECVPLVEKICTIIPKGNKLTEILRKTVAKPKLYSEAKSILLKRMIEG